jgi:hypothetical protein
MMSALLRMIVLAMTSMVVMSCNADRLLSPADYEGEYPLLQVNDRDLGWYHDVPGECQLAYTSGSLVITSSQSTGREQFLFRVDFNVRCLGVDPFDGSGSLGVQGTDVKPGDGKLVLNGFGPSPVIGVDRWSLEVRPVGSNIDVRILGVNGELWADPVFIMGPKQAYTGPALSAASHRVLGAM